MFKRNSSSPDDPQSTVDHAASTSSQKKGRRTPTRKEAEASNTHPLVAGDRRLAKKLDKERRAEAYERERVALQTGEERYLPYRDKGHVRRFTRNWVDARWSVSEFVLPVMLIFLVGTLLLGWVNPAWGQGTWVILGATIGLYGFFFVSLLEGILVWHKIKKKVAIRYPKDPIPRGSWFYCWARMIMARRWRSPKPQVARGEFPEVPDQTAK